MSNHCPSHKLAWCKSSDSEDDEVLVVACGSNIHSVSLVRGTVLSTWPPARTINDEEQRPEKKRKLESDLRLHPASVIELVSSQDGRFVVAVTAEDKCVHVFEVGRDAADEGRCMPKRPSALALARASREILVADKFGDVYAIPLVPTSEDEAAFVEASRRKEDLTRLYKPAATTLTVHSKRNLAALKQQTERKDTEIKAKEPLDFSHKLLLGHVSMLTDVLFVESDDAQQTKTYIITSDRDEHIRVSRGPPQSHVIEHYCLGHAAFVTKLCLLRPDVLISGGADDYLCVWRWERGQLIKRVQLDESQANIRSSMSTVRSTDPLTEGRNGFIVSGMWTFPGQTRHPTHLLLAFEGVPSLLIFLIRDFLDSNGAPTTERLQLPGNVLDVVATEHSVFVAVDQVHEPSSTTVRRAEQITGPITAVFKPLATDSCTFKHDEAMESRLQNIEVSSDRQYDTKQLAELLYSAGRLKKRDADDVGAVLD